MKIVEKAIQWKGLVGLAIALLAFTLGGCIDSDRSAEPAVPVGYVSLYHASPDGPALDILVDGRLINSAPFVYSEYSDYLRFYTGKRNLKFNTLNAASSLVDTTLDVDDGKAYSVFVVNTLSSGIESLIVADSSSAPASDKAMIRFVNLSPDAPAVDVLTSDSGAPAIANNKAFKGVTAFEAVSAGTYTFDVYQTGTQSKMISANNIRIQPGRFYTIVARGFVNPPNGNTNVLSLEVL